jgi:hypothetical protein
VVARSKMAQTRAERSLVRSFEIIPEVGGFALQVYRAAGRV